MCALFNFCFFPGNVATVVHNYLVVVFFFLAWRPFFLSSVFECVLHFGM